MDRDELLARYPFPAVIDNTMRQSWWTCPHLFFRQHVQGLRRKDTDEAGNVFPTRNIHLHFGAALARGLEVSRKSYCEFHNTTAAIDDGATALIEAWGSEALPAPTNRNEENKTLEACLLAHDGYFRFFGLDDPEHYISGPEMVEVSGARPIPGTAHPVTGEPIVYAGRFDAICTRSGVLWGLDDKTTGSNVDSAAWRSQWTLSGQFSGYTWLAAGYGFDIKGFLIHGVQVLTATIRYAEATTPRARWQVDQWLRQLQTDVEAMTTQYEEFIASTLYGRDPPTSHPFGQAFGSACHAYNRPCTFLDDICAQPNPEDWIDSAFVVERWNPLKRNVDE